MQYFRAPVTCPCGNPLSELGEPCSFLAVKLFIADSDKTLEPWEGGPKKRLGLLAVCSGHTNAEGFDRTKSEISGRGVGWE